MPSPDDIAYVRNLCPRLRAFALDVNRSHTRAATHAARARTYAALAAFPRLRHVQLHCDVGLARHDRARTAGTPDAWYRLTPAGTRSSELLPPDEGPLETVDAAFVKAVWERIGARKVGRPLASVVVKVGERFQPSSGSLGGSVMRASDDKKVWTATRGERDGAGGDCEITSGDIDRYEDIHQDSFA